MPRPGIDVISRAAPPSSGIPTDTGVWFVVGMTDRGPTDRPVEIHNMTEYEKYFGPRVSYSVLYDSLEAFFREGGSRAQVLRVVGPAGTKDTVTLNDAGAAASIAVDSLGAGPVAFTVDVVAGANAGEFVLVIKDNGVEVERSPSLVDVAAAVSWSTASAFVRVRSLGANDPNVQANVALVGGNDDRAAITDAHRVTALGLFGRGLGPGQVSVPGSTTGTIHNALLDHARINNRTAIIDLPDTASNTTLAAAADAIRTSITSASGGRSYGGSFGPWVTIPGIVRGTTRTIPPSPIVAGLIARRDGETANPNDPAAGSAGEARFAIGLSQVDFTDAVRTALNDKGVNLLRMIYGAVRVYGFRTLVDFTTGESWLGLNEARTRMAITTEAERYAEGFTFAQIDGRGRKIAEFGGGLTGILNRYYNLGALYGDSPEEAFFVDTGPTVNTPATLADLQLRAVLAVRTSPFAELVTIEIVRVPITTSL